MAKGKIADYSRSKLINIIDSRVQNETGEITAVTAGNGLSGGGTSGAVTLAVDVDGATDGTGITVSVNDVLLIADADDSNNVKKINVSQLPGNPGGSDTQFQYNNGGVFAGTSNLVYNNSTGYVGIGVAAGNTSHALTLPNTAGAAGQIKANAYITYSSARLKENISKITNPIELLKNIQGVTFEWKENKKSDIGFIAEDVGKHLPQIVEWEENKLDAQGLDYNKIIPILVEANKYQQSQIDKMKTQITFLIDVLNRN
jgi:hypothetical protein